MNINYLSDKPIEDGVVLLRGEEGEAYTNVPRVVVRHSPDGFEWGYGGSRPSDLALNLVEHILQSLNFRGMRIQTQWGSCFILSANLYQDFKEEFILTANHEGDILPWDTVVNWVQHHIELEVSS